MANADRIIELLHEAKARPSGAERERFLAEACGDDAALREQIVSLIKADADEGKSDFLKLTRIIRPTIPVTEKPGDRIGRYKLLEQIGEGGCGVVYMAEQEEPVRRRVALKVIKLGMDTKQVIARFEAERQALAMMDHPNIAKIFDAGITDTPLPASGHPLPSSDEGRGQGEGSPPTARHSSLVTSSGRPFFVMELVRGIKITDYCDQNNLATKERLELFIQVCQAIQHAHQKGIIHRDIKPSNILVTQHDDVAVPKVIDFGIAKATVGQLTDKTVFTAFAQFIGTPAYMSPEQAQMSGLDVDTRADIYSLGVLLYELLTGHTPFDAKELLAAGMDEMRRKIREDEPAKPSTCLSTMQAMDLTTVAKRRHVEPPRLIHLIRGDLDWLVMKCLEKDRTRRYETANGLALDIQRHLSNEPVAARPPSSLYRFQKLVRRNKLAFVAGVAVTGALVLGVVASSWQAVRAIRAEALAQKRVIEVAAERDAKDEARQQAEVIATFLTGVFQSPDPGRDGYTITVAETLSRAAEQLDNDLANQPVRRAMLQRTLGLTYIELGLASKAIPLLEKARNYQLSTYGPKHVETVRAALNLAYGYASSGRRDEAILIQETNLVRLQELFGPENSETLGTMNQLAINYASAGRHQEAIEFHKKISAFYQKSLGPEHPSTIHAVNSLVHSYVKARQMADAEQVLGQLVPLCRRVLGAEHAETIWAVDSLANLYGDTGRKREALALLETNLESRRKKRSQDHPGVLSAAETVAWYYAGAGRRDEAIKLQEEVLLASRKALGAEHPDVLNLTHNLATFYNDAGRSEDALKLREELLPIRQKVLGREHPNTLWTSRDLALSYRDAGRQPEAIALMESTLESRRKVLGADHKYTYQSMQDLVIFHCDAGHLDEALRFQTELSLRFSQDALLALRLAIFQAWLGRELEHAATCRRMFNLAAETNDVSTAERAAKAWCLRPASDPQSLATALTLARRAVDLGKTHRDLPYFQLTLGMAEYRNSNYAAAEQALTAAEKLGKGNDNVENPARIFRAMSLFRQGKETEARHLFTETEAQMKPLPADERRPFQNGASHDDLFLWLTYKEAKSLLQVEAKAEPAKSGAK